MRICDVGIVSCAALEETLARAEIPRRALYECGWEPERQWTAREGERRERRAERVHFGSGVEAEAKENTDGIHLVQHHIMLFSVGDAQLKS